MKVSLSADDRRPPLPDPPAGRQEPGAAGTGRRPHTPEAYFLLFRKTVNMHQSFQGMNCLPAYQVTVYMEGHGR